jgi:hypothetical protein
MEQRDFIGVKHNYVHMPITRTLTMLPHLSEKGFANELKLRIWKGDHLWRLNRIRSL